MRSACVSARAFFASIEATRPLNIASFVNATCPPPSTFYILLYTFSGLVSIEINGSFTLHIPIFFVPITYLNCRVKWLSYIYDNVITRYMTMFRGYGAINRPTPFSISTVTTRQIDGAHSVQRRSCARKEEHRAEQKSSDASATVRDR